MNRGWDREPMVTMGGGADMGREPSGHRLGFPLEQGSHRVALHDNQNPRSLIGCGDSKSSLDGSSLHYHADFSYLF